MYSTAGSINTAGSFSTAVALKSVILSLFLLKIILVYIKKIRIFA